MIKFKEVVDNFESLLLFLYEADRQNFELDGDLLKPESKDKQIGYAFQCLLPNLIKIFKYDTSSKTKEFDGQLFPYSSSFDYGYVESSFKKDILLKYDLFKYLYTNHEDILKHPSDFHNLYFENDKKMSPKIKKSYGGIQSDWTNTNTTKKIWFTLPSTCYYGDTVFLMQIDVTKPYDYINVRISKFLSVKNNRKSELIFSEDILNAEGLYPTRNIELDSLNDLDAGRVLMGNIGFGCRINVYDLRLSDIILHLGVIQKYLDGE